MTEFLLSVARITVLVYAGLCLWLFLRQASYLYYPSREVACTPRAIGLGYEEVVLRTSDHETIAAWYIPAAGARGTLLYAHGNAGTRADRLDHIRLFHDLGLNVLIFDYRGYGESTGRPSEEGTYRDALAAWDYLVEGRRTPPAGIVLYGESLGGAVAAWLAGERTSGALVIQGAFTSVPDMAAKLYPYLPVRWLCRFRYDTRQRLAKVRCPVLIAHSPTDEVVPYTHGRRLYEAANSPKVFLALTGGHNDGLLAAEDASRESLKSFLDQHVGGEAVEP